MALTITTSNGQTYEVATDVSAQEFADGQTAGWVETEDGVYVQVSAIVSVHPRREPGGMTVSVPDGENVEPGALADLGKF